jgi:hypothetical protein
MPATSQRMFRAMEAAAHGHSTLGIPASVGQEFVAATGSPKGLPERAPKMRLSQAIEHRKRRKRGH